MTAILKVDTIQDTAGNNIINESSDTITIGAAGDTVTVPGTEVKSNKLSPASGTALQIGDSGDTITIPSGATITNSGTATGFGGITVADSWRITSGFNFTTLQTIDQNWERVDTTGQGTIGSAMTQSSGVFTFPSTGIYLVVVNIGFSSTTSTRYIETQIDHSSDSGSNWSYISRGNTFVNNVASTTFTNASVFSYVDVTNASTARIRFRVSSDGTANMPGSSSYNEGQSFLFIRLGDT